MNDVLSSRGGFAPNKMTIDITPKTKCLRIFKTMTIRPTGEVSLCCSDALGQYTLGDVTKDSLIDIWYKSSKYRKIRQIMQTKGRKGLALCKDCDFEA